MSLKDMLMEDLKTSMKEKDNLRKNTITMLRSRIKQYEVDNREDANDDLIMQMIQKELKERSDTLESLKDSNRDDLIEDTKAEIAILEKYLPKQLSDDELAEIIEKIIAETKAESIKDMGKVMASAKEQIGSRATPKRMSEIIKEKLSSKN
ncbi:GatB/YqeY domain-containing protein [uncultured Ezakiella sp.]|uniref:GatB/YqeY domain-containing protein n=1 Tax=uncultured Ezakiella sp. TaxID=1637529 RepID=UPI0025DC63C7|nr:GatB/YqeY domain-containing protein [uncultured Ezakiella sp.]